jgi:hypothetical protein
MVNKIINNNNNNSNNNENDDFGGGAGGANQKETSWRCRKSEHKYSTIRKQCKCLKEERRKKRNLLFSHMSYTGFPEIQKSMLDGCGSSNTSALSSNGRIQ